MKVSQLTRMLSRAGCFVKRHGGDHDIWYSPITGKIDEVPRHGSEEVKKGTLRRILKNLLGQ